MKARRLPSGEFLTCSGYSDSSSSTSSSAVTATLGLCLACSTLHRFVPCSLWSTLVGSVFLFSFVPVNSLTFAGGGLPDASTGSVGCVTFVYMIDGGFLSRAFRMAFPASRFAGSLTLAAFVSQRSLDTPACLAGSDSRRLVATSCSDLCRPFPRRQSRLVADSRCTRRGRRCWRRESLGLAPGEVVVRELLPALLAQLFLRLVPVVICFAVIIRGVE